MGVGIAKIVRKAHGGRGKTGAQAITFASDFRVLPASDSVLGNYKSVCHSGLGGTWWAWELQKACGRRAVCVCVGIAENCSWGPDDR